MFVENCRWKHLWFLYCSWKYFMSPSLKITVVILMHFCTHLQNLQGHLLCFITTEKDDSFEQLIQFSSILRRIHSDCERWRKLFWRPFLPWKGCANSLHLEDSKSFGSWRDGKGSSDLFIFQKPFRKIFIDLGPATFGWTWKIKCRSFLIGIHSASWRTRRWWFVNARMINSVTAMLIETICSTWKKAWCGITHTGFIY